MAHLAATGDRQVTAFTMLVTVLDQSSTGLTGSLIDEQTARAAMKASDRQGYLDGNALAEVFAWLRPNDLIWNYWVNNYLLGRKPPPFDILYWNADTTRMPARLHHDFLRLAMSNALVTPDAAMMLGTPVDLGKVDADSYVVAGVADHLCRWQSCYQSTQLLGGYEPLRALDERAHRRTRQPARQPEGQLPSRRRSRHRGRCGGHRRPNARADRGGPTTPTGWRRDQADRRTLRPPWAEIGFEPREAAPGTYVFEK